MMKKKFYALGLFLSCIPSIAPLAAVNAWQSHEPKMPADIVEIRDLKHLHLFLNNNMNHQPYRQFSRIEESLKACERMPFAMNAGMYHSDYQPVGLYIERGQEINPVNRQTSTYGNFFIQPNGILAWDDQQASIVTTADFVESSGINTQYATQSGPMLVIKGNINAKFSEDSDSFKIRNGVGIKNQTLYFVISQKPVTFYQFAQFFKDDLNVTDALYLDGSISSAAIMMLNRYDQHRYLGPIVAYIDDSLCVQ